MVDSTWFLACEHRNTDGLLILSQMKHLPCRSTVRVFEPLPEYRNVCPQVLVVCHGEHDHPIPLPAKTPPPIRAELFRLLESLDYDLADLTPRRFLRHPIVKSYLHERLPKIQNPALCDLHPSLANREHLKAFISLAKEKSFPLGTGWDGE